MLHTIMENENNVLLMFRSLSLYFLYVKIPSLLPIILDRSVAHIKSMNIYIGVGATAFPITCHVKNNNTNVTV